MSQCVAMPAQYQEDQTYPTPEQGSGFLQSHLNRIMHLRATAYLHCHCSPARHRMAISHVAEVGAM